MGIIDSIKHAKQEREMGFGFKAPAEYLGGHAAHVKKASGNILTDREGVVFKTVVLGKEVFTIPYKGITAIESDTATRLSIGRLLLVGIFAFAWKKKDKFLKITYKDETDFENSVVFGKLNADEWKGIISRARQNHLKLCSEGDKK